MKKIISLFVLSIFLILSSQVFALEEVTQDEWMVDFVSKLGKKEKKEVKKQKIPENWIAQTGKLYLKENRTKEDDTKLIKLLEAALGINKNGTLNLIRTRDAKVALQNYERNPDKEFTNIYFDDKLNLCGYNYIYFELCTFNKDTKSERFRKYFENGFYPDRSLYIKEEYYYKILYYYLYVVQDKLISKLNKSIEQLNTSPDKAPNFTDNDIRTLDTVVQVCTDLDELRIKDNKEENSPYKKIFSADEITWINSSIDYFTDINTHIALFSYKWFKENLPLSISAKVVAHDIKETWTDQTIAYRSMLPLMLFKNNKGGIQFSVDKLFTKTLDQLKLDNREVDIVVMSALKTWLLKQIEHGIRVEDRIRYKKILDELDVCPSGWIFYNLYSCKAPLDELKLYTSKWDSYSKAEKEKIFNDKIQTYYYDAIEKINIVFSDLEKIFGKEEIFGREQKSTSINYIFHQYRGEINFYYEYLQYGLYEDQLASIRLPLANSNTNCLKDFIAAFIKASDIPENHINLLNAYDLLFSELSAQGKINEMIRYEDEMEVLINSAHKLGSIIDHTKDNRYNIYKTIANTYIANKSLQTKALQIARKSYELARNYYVKAAVRKGYVYKSTPGALTTNATEIDDFERQYEFYQKIAGKLGKKVSLLIPEDDVKLYNRMQDMRNPRGFKL